MCAWVILLFVFRFYFDMAMINGVICLFRAVFYCFGLDRVVSVMLRNSSFVV